MTPLVLMLATVGLLAGIGGFCTCLENRDFPWANALPTSFLLIIVCMGFYQLVWH